MIKINLLPHREAARRARRQQFYALTGLVSVLAGVIWFLGFSIISRQIDAQTAKNDFLKQEITLLDKDIAEIKKLRGQTDSLLARKRVIEALQANRTETVHLFNTLATYVPEGIYLRSLIQTGQKIALVGIAQSNAVETKADIVGSRRLNAFSISTFVTRQVTENTATSPRRGKK